MCKTDKNTIECGRYKPLQTLLLNQLAHVLQVLECYICFAHIKKKNSSSPRRNRTWGELAGGRDLAGVKNGGNKVC